MKNLKKFSSIMEAVNSTSKLKDSERQVEVVYDVFKGTNRYVSPMIHMLCSKTACDIAIYIIMTIKRNQTSIKFTTTDLINSQYIKSKSKVQLHNAIKELINNGIIARWRDIEEIPNREEIPKSWYFLNPQMIKCIGCKNFKEQVEVTVRCIENSKHCTINEFSAIVYDFNNTNKTILESQFKDCIKYDE